jgi:hypothetical protein
VCAIYDRFLNTLRALDNHAAPAAAAARLIDLLILLSCTIYNQTLSDPTIHLDHIAGHPARCVSLAWSLASHSTASVMSAGVPSRRRNVL